MYNFRVCVYSFDTADCRCRRCRRYRRCHYHVEYFSAVSPAKHYFYLFFYFFISVFSFILLMSATEPAISTTHCARLYGIFADVNKCDVFWNCWNGEASRYQCSPGLAYDRESRVCMWADQVPECKNEGKFNRDLQHRRKIESVFLILFFSRILFFMCITRSLAAQKLQTVSDAQRQVK